MSQPTSNPTPLAAGSVAGVERDLVTAFLENIPDYVYFKDRESRFIAVSTSMMKLLGAQKPEELLGKSDSDFFTEAHAGPALADEKKIMATGQGIHDFVEKEVWPDGHVTWVRTSKMPLRNAQGEIIGTFGISQDITAAKQVEHTLEKTRKELLDASRQAGMAEVATGVLHNVGNVLNSLNVSTAVVSSGLQESKTDSLAKAVELLLQNRSRLSEFLTQDAKGSRLPDLLAALSTHFSTERTRLLQEIESLQKSVDHIKEIVSMQQTYAKMIGIVEPLDPVKLLENSLRINASVLLRHEVHITRDFQPTAPVMGEKGKILQILVNLIRNAKYACDEGTALDKQIVLRICPGRTPGRVHIAVQDNGIGIKPENMTRIFQHGTTTRTQGHGFGLHYSTLAAKEMKGELRAHSDGPNRGATFTLDLPAAPAGSVPAGEKEI